MKYDVQVSCQVIAFGTVQVEADNEDDARDYAIMAAQDESAGVFEIDWMGDHIFNLLDKRSQ